MQRCAGQGKPANKDTLAIILGHNTNNFEAVKVAKTFMRALLWISFGFGGKLGEERDRVLTRPVFVGATRREGGQGERFVITGAYKSTSGTQSEESRSRGDNPNGYDQTRIDGHSLMPH